jgi:Major Facilitator Superfamily
LIAPFLGVFVDRWSRRSILAVTNYIRGALLLSFPLWSRAAPGDSDLYIAVLLLLGIGRLALTAKGASLPVVLHEHDLLPGNSLSAGGGMISALLGGVIGVFVADATGTAVALVIAGCVYAVSGLLATRISVSLDHENPRALGLRDALARVLRDLKSGLGAVYSSAGARLALTSLFLLRWIGMITVVAAVLVIRREYPDAGDGFDRLTSSASALGAAGLGAFVGASTAPMLGRRFDEARLIISGYVISGVGIIALGGVFDIRALLLLTFIGGLGGFLTKVAVDAQLQNSLEDLFRGRAFALYDILYNVASVLAALVIVITDGASLRAVLLGTGLVTLFLAIALRRAMLQTSVMVSAPSRA